MGEGERCERNPISYSSASSACKKGGQWAPAHVRRACSGSPILPYVAQAPSHARKGEQWEPGRISYYTAIITCGVESATAHPPGAREKGEQWGKNLISHCTATSACEKGERWEPKQLFQGHQQPLIETIGASARPRGLSGTHLIIGTITIIDTIGVSARPRGLPGTHLNIGRSIRIETVGVSARPRGLSGTHLNIGKSARIDNIGRGAIMATIGVSARPRPLSGTHLNISTLEEAQTLKLRCRSRFRSRDTSVYQNQASLRKSAAPRTRIDQRPVIVFQDSVQETPLSIKTKHAHARAPHLEPGLARATHAWTNRLAERQTPKFTEGWCWPLFAWCFDCLMRTGNGPLRLLPAGRERAVALACTEAGSNPGIMGVGDILACAYAQCLLGRSLRPPPQQPTPCPSTPFPRHRAPVIARSIMPMMATTSHKTRRQWKALFIMLAVLLHDVARLSDIICIATGDAPGNTPYKWAYPTAAADGEHGPQEYVAALAGQNLHAEVTIYAAATSVHPRAVHEMAAFGDAMHRYEASSHAAPK